MPEPRLEDLVSLKGRTALITGSARGIGKATALRFAEAGADLYLVDIDRDGLEEVRRSISEYGVDVEVYQVDLSRKSRIDSLWAELEGREPDILVNNAGVYFFRDTLSLSMEDVEHSISVNLLSTLWMSLAMIRARLGKGGVIVNVSSIEAILPFATGLVHYSTAKAGVIALTRALAREYGRRGFRVNAVVPGGIETEAVKKLKKEALLHARKDLIELGRMFMQRLPMGRLGTPDEVARVILFLASDMASYVNGAVIVVDGGFLSA